MSGADVRLFRLFFLIYVPVDDGAGSGVLENVRFAMYSSSGIDPFLL